MQNSKRIFMTDFDLKRLDEMLSAFEPSKSKDNAYVQLLKSEMQKARVVASEKIQGDVVTMNSRVRLEDMDNHEEFVFQVVYPSDADLEQGKISVLAPIGTALLGYRVGDVVSWPVPGGRRKFKIRELLYQPEREGNFYH